MKKQVHEAQQQRYIIQLHKNEVMAVFHDSHPIAENVIPEAGRNNRGPGVPHAAFRHYVIRVDLT